MAKGICFWMGLLTLVLPAVALGEDVALREEIQDLRCFVTGLESAQAGSNAGGKTTALTSMKKKGTVKIGGRVDVDLYFSNRDDTTSSSDEVDNTRFTTTTAALMFRVNATRDTWLHIKLDIDDCWNGLQQDDLLEEVYFHWSHIGGSPWALNFGKKEVPYGVDKDPAITKSYHHNTGLGNASYLGKANEQAGGTANPHSRVGTYLHPGERDNAFQITGICNWKDLAKFEISLFQNPTARGMHEDRSDDHLGFQSFCGRLTLTPIEGLTLTASAINEHHDSFGDGQLRLSMANPRRLPAGSEEDATADQTAINLAAAYHFKSVPLQLYTEYQHGWDWLYDDDLTVDILSVGAIYGIRPNIDIIAIGEWLRYEAGNNSALYNRDDDEDYYKAQIATRYKLDSGVHLLMEYLHEWYHNDRSTGDSREADVVAFRTMFVF